MTVIVANTANNNTFDYWRNRTNELAYYMSVYAVTANGSNAAVGNAAITGNFNANALFTNNITSNVTITTGNASINAVYINTTSISVGNSTVNSQANSTYFKTLNVLVGANLTLNTSSAFITGLVGGVSSNLSLDKQKLYITANATSSISVNAYMVDIINGSDEVQLTANQFLMGTSVINSTAFTTGAGGFTANTSVAKVGSNVVVNTSSLNITSSGFAHLSNSTSVNLNSTSDTLFANSSLLKISNTAGVSANLTNDYLVIGNSTVNSTIITTGTGGLIANTSAVRVGSNVYTNTSTVYLSNGVVNTTINASTMFIGNNSVNSISNSSLFTLANSSTNTVLTSSYFTVSNATYSTTVNAAGVYVNGTIVVNGNTTAIGNVELGQVGSGYANVKNDLFVRGNLIVNGSLTYTGNAVGDVIPAVDSIYSLGNNANKWYFLYVNSTSVSNNLVVGSNVSLNTSTISVGNFVVNSGYLSVNGYIIANSTGIYAANSVNAASYNVGSLTIANSSGVYTTVVNASSYTVGATFSANATLVNASAINITGQVNTATLYSTTSVNVASAVQLSSVGVNTTATVNALNITAGAGFTANSSAVNANSLIVANTLSVGNSTVNVVTNSSSVAIGNSTTSIIITNPTSTQISQGNTYLASNGSWVQLPLSLTTSTSNTTGTATQNIDSYQMSIFNGAEYVIHVNDQSTGTSNARYIAKLLTTHDRTTGFVTEYASIYSNTQNTLGVFSATTNTSHFILQFTPNALITNTNVRFVRTIM